MCAKCSGAGQQRTSDNNKVKYFIVRDLNDDEVELVGLEEVNFQNRSTLTSQSVEGARRVVTQDGFNLQTDTFEIPEKIDGKRVVSVGEDAFKQYFFSLRWLTISRFVKKINLQRLDSLPMLCEIIVDSKNSTFASENGVLFDRGKKKLVCYPPGINQEEYLVPEGVETIDDHAFSSNCFIKRVTLQAGVKKIGKSAFSYCSHLNKIDMPKGVECIDSRAFAECGALNRVTIPSSVKTVGEAAFYHCKSLKVVNLLEGVENISYKAFSDCSALKDITLSESIQSVGTHAFLGCVGLEKIEVKEKNRFFASKDGVLFNNSNCNQ